MGVLSQRHPGYKGGLGVLVLGSVVFVVGFATPHWAHYKLNYAGNSTEGNSGLWVDCVHLHGHSTCTTSSSSDGWLIAVKAFESMAMVGLVLAACYAVGVNFLLAKPRFSRFLEICTACAGAFGVIGATTYVAQARSAVDAFNRLAAGSGTSFDHFTVQWSFGVTIAGSVIVLLAAFFIARNNKPLPHSATAGIAVAYTTFA